MLRQSIKIIAIRKLLEYTATKELKQEMQQVKKPV